jgi:hypothetical protein
MIKMKFGAFVAVALAATAAGCGDSSPREGDVTPIETIEVPSLTPDSAAIRDSIAMAQADSIAAAAAETPSTNRPGSTPAAGGTGPTIWDGIYTTAQASYGEEIYNAVCFNCHTLDQWQDPGVLTRHGNTLGGLFGFVSDQMPQSEPGSLYPEDYAGIVAYMLSLNGVPSGNQALPTTYQAMDRIRVTPHP